MPSVLYSLPPSSACYLFASSLCVYLTWCSILRTFKRSSRLDAASDLGLTYCHLSVLQWTAQLHSVLLSFCWKAYLLTLWETLQLGSLSKLESTWRPLVKFCWVFPGSFMSDNDCLLETRGPVLTSPLLSETPVHGCRPSLFFSNLDRKQGETKGAAGRVSSWLTLLSWRQPWCWCSWCAFPGANCSCHCKSRKSCRE